MAASILRCRRIWKIPYSPLTGKMGKTIKSIDVETVEKRRVPSKHYVYVIKVKWSDGSCFTIYRRYSRFFDLQTSLLDNFPIEGGTVDPNNRIIPFLPGKIFFGRSQIKDVAMKRLGEINQYCKKLITLPVHIANCDQVNDFFEVEPDDLDPPEQNSKSKGSKEKKVDKISKPKKLERYVAVSDYQAQENGELSLLPGLVVEVLEKSDTGWWFVNSEDDQGWVPCTYLEPEDGTEIQPAVRAELGEEEIFVCISDFTATNSDEISLEKGVAVSVLQKNMNGWFLIRYQGTEGYAPGTYLKKANNAQRMSVVEKSRLSGVEIIGSLQDVSTLLNHEKQEETKRDSSPMSQKRNQSVPPAVIVKQHSLERRGNFRPPPRQGSIKKLEVPSSLKPVRGIYVTVSDFTANVEDGLSFKSGEKVLVKEKTPTGWWFVKTKHEEGWVPSTYLEPYCGEPDTRSVYELANLDDEDDEDIDEFDGGYSDDGGEDDDDDWYAQPDESVIVPAAPSKHEEIQKRPLPKIPSEEQHYEKAEEVFNSPVRKPVSSRDLPPPPAPPVGVKKKEDTPKETPLPPKPLSASTENLEKQEHVTCEPSDTFGGKTDLAAVLKAKFESRSVDSGDKTPLGDSENNKPAKPSKPAVPMLPAKPPDFKKSVPSKPDLPVTPSAKPAIQSQDRRSKFSKPPPPAKSKAILPTRQAHQENTTEKEIPKHPLKPTVKSGSPIIPKKFASSESNINVNKSSDALKQGASIADRSAAFSKPSASIGNRSAAFNKPSASIADKPAAFNKPGTSIADKAAAFNKSGTSKADKAAAFNKPGAPPTGKADAFNKPGAPLADKAAAFNKPGTSIADKAAAFNKSGAPPADKAAAFNKPGSSIADKAAALNKSGALPSDKAAAFNKPGSSLADRAAAFNKPTVSPQTKPKLLGRPEKPAKPMKPTLAAKPQIPAKTNQKVSNIANSLNNKLNLHPSQTPAVDQNSNLEQVNSVASPTPAIIPKQDKIVPNSQTAVDTTSEGLYTAVFDFVAENEGEITFNEGDELEMVEFGEDWSYVRVWDEEGWAPTSYLEKT